MLIRLYRGGIVFSLVAAMVCPARAQTPPASVLDPLIPRIKAVVRQAQPRASFALGQDILIGQYRTANDVIHPHDRSGHALPPYVELAPRRGGFYLQISVANAPVPTHPQVTPATPGCPWTTVISFYPLSGGHALVMTWQAAAGAPHNLAQKVGQVLSDYAAKSN